MPPKKKATKPKPKGMRLVNMSKNYKANQKPVFEEDKPKDKPLY